MKIKTTRIYVDNQDRALRFYTEVLGMAKKADFSNGPYRWLTVGSADDANAIELQLALNDDPAAKAYQQAMFPTLAATSFKSARSRSGRHRMTPSQKIDGRIEELGDWRGRTLARVRALIKEVDPGVVEEWKWRGVPVWYRDGMICTGETYKSVVKFTFANGAALADPAKLFNSSLEGNVRRAIDIGEGEKVNERALKALVRAAIEHNQSKLKSKLKKKAPVPAKAHKSKKA
jgi:hypothetical protein